MVSIHFKGKQTQYSIVYVYTDPSACIKSFGSRLCACERRLGTNRVCTIGTSHDSRLILQVGPKETEAALFLLHIDVKWQSAFTKSSERLFGGRTPVRLQDFELRHRSL